MLAKNKGGQDVGVEEVTEPLAKLSWGILEFVFQ